MLITRNYIAGRRYLPTTGLAWSRVFKVYHLSKSGGDKLQKGRGSMTSKVDKRLRRNI